MNISKETAMWVLIAVLFIGMAVLFTMNYNKSKYKSCDTKSWRENSSNYSDADCTRSKEEKADK